MREIKFRVWNAKDGWYFPSGEEPALKSNGELDCELGFYDCLVVEQHTGLKDKNGVEIYEGDVVRLIGDSMWKHEGIYTVGWDRGTFNLTHKSLTMGMRTLLDLDFNLIEVLGNTHEGNFKDNDQCPAAEQGEVGSD